VQSWQRPFDAPDAGGPPTIAGGSIFISSGRSGVVRVFRLSDGHELWGHGRGSTIFDAPAVADKAVLFGDWKAACGRFDRVSHEHREEHEMTRLRLGALGLATLAVLAASLPTAGIASKPKPVVKTAHVGDDYFTPYKSTIKHGSHVNWVWSSKNLEAHNVTLTAGPNGIKKRKFTSATGARGIKFDRVFTMPGTYRFICTLHPDFMNMIVVVKR
jgi:plastocyanin